MPRAANRITHDEALGQRGTIVRAGGANREYLNAASHEENWFTARVPEQHRSIWDCRKLNSLGEIRPAQFAFYWAHWVPSTQVRGTRELAAIPTCQHRRNHMLGLMLSVLDVTQDALLQAARGWLIFLSRHVLLGLGDQFDRLVKAVGARESNVDRDVIMNALSVSDRGAPDFRDSHINNSDSLSRLILHPACGRSAGAGKPTNKSASSSACSSSTASMDLSMWLVVGSWSARYWISSR